MNKKAALVLSGGAARGLAHIGVIEELERQNYKISSLSGNSMGAFIGAVYVMNKLPEFKDWILTLDKKNIFKYLDFSFGKQGFIKGNKIINKLKTFFPDTDIKNLQIPFSIVAGDIQNMKEVVFTEGSLYEAIRASVSVPGIFKPVKKDTMILVDGGVVNPIPINRVKRTKNDLLIASYVNAEIPYFPVFEDKQYIKDLETDYKRKINEFKNKLNNILSKENKEKLNYFTLLSKSTNLLTHKLSVMNIEKYKPDILINISRRSASHFDFLKAKELIEAGRKATKESLRKVN